MTLSVRSGNVIIRPYQTEDKELWDELVNRSWNGTFLHTRKFLSYHGDRFLDKSIVVLNRKEQLIGVLPAAVDPKSERTVVSHPGITYGGLVHDGKIRGNDTLNLFRDVFRLYKSLGFTSFLYKVTPYIYHKTPSQDDLYVLFRLGAERYRTDISSTIDLRNASELSNDRKWSMRKAVQNHLEVLEGASLLRDVWSVVESNLQEQHGAKPVHSLGEITSLINRFPESIRVYSVIHDGGVVAGAVVFVTARVAHAQYIANSRHGRTLRALDPLIQRCIADARDLGVAFFDFGISNESAGKYLNDGLYRFKNSFGAGGVVHDFYNVDLGITEFS